MSFGNLCEHILAEITYNNLKTKQKSIGKLFPEFGQRVKTVASKGGVQMREMMPEHWHFTVTSGTKEGVKYDVYVQFNNIPEMIKKYAGDKSLWVKDGSRPNYNLLAAEILNNVDMKLSCSCPADLYWGGAYIKTQRDAQFGRQEDRPPNIRNPHQYGAYCKHTELLASVLPNYTSTFASFLKKYWEDEVNDTVELLAQQQAEFGAAGEELGKMADEKPTAMRRGGSEVPLPPQDDLEDEEDEEGEGGVPLPDDEPEPPPNVGPQSATKTATGLPAKATEPGLKRHGIEPESEHRPKDRKRKGNYEPKESVNEDTDPFVGPDEADLELRASTIEHGPISRRLGKCYELSGEYVMDNPGWELVHGTITRQDGSNYTIGHGWVEKMETIHPRGGHGRMGVQTRMVHDPVWGKTMPWEAYIYYVGAKEEKRYTESEMRKQITKHKHWGPWND